MLQICNFMKTRNIYAKLSVPFMTQIIQHGPMSSVIKIIRVVMEKCVKFHNTTWVLSTNCLTFHFSGSDLSFHLVSKFERMNCYDRSPTLNQIESLCRSRRLQSVTCSDFN